MEKKLNEIVLNKNSQFHHLLKIDLSTTDHLEKSLQTLQSEYPSVSSLFFYSHNL